MEFNFCGKKVLITGAARGIGRQLAISFVKAGADVYALDILEADLDTLTAECGEKVHTFKVDLADWDATRAVLEQLPTMDGLVNNAGILGPDSSILDASKTAINQIFDVNLFAALNVAQVVAKKMIADGKPGSIVNTSSIAGLRSATIGVGYSLSKAALNMLSMRLAQELGPNRIRVNSINPIFVNTDMAEEYKKTFPDKYKKICEHTPLGRFAEIAEIVAPVMYLLSDGSSMVTGTTHVIDGGCISNIGV